MFEKISKVDIFCTILPPPKKKHHLQIILISTKNKSQMFHKILKANICFLFFYSPEEETHIGLYQLSNKIRLVNILLEKFFLTVTIQTW